MIEGAREHGESRSRFLIERPEAEIIAMEIRTQGCDRASKEIVCRSIAGRKREITHAPHGPDKTIQNMGGRRDDVFLKPKTAVLVGEADAAFISGRQESLERTGSGFQIFG